MGEQAVNQELEELLSFIPANNSEVVSKLLEYFSYDQEKQNEIVARYNALLNENQVAVRSLIP